jgi:hypothetical protein
MAMTLHHFRKEFRYLRLRWFAFLGLLGLDLAVNLEWVMPVRAGTVAPGWLAYVSTLLMLAGMSLMGSSPEDKPGSDRSFISTRPLPVRAYWKSRIALWVLLLVVPVVVQNALYLLLSHRPAAEVLMGTGLKALGTLGLTAWVLPMTGLWRRGEFWIALGCLAAGLLIADRVIEAAALKWMFTSVTYRQNQVGMAVAELAFAAGILWMAWRHQAGGERSFGRRVGVMVGIGALCLTLGRLWPWNDEDRPHNQARVMEMARGLRAEVDLGMLEFTSFAEDQQRQLFLPVRTRTGEPRVSVQLRPQSVETVQGERASRSKPDFYLRSRGYNLQLLSQMLMATDGVLRDLFPVGTIFTTSGERSQWGMLGQRNPCVGKFDAPFPDPAKPLRITTDFEADWYEREIVMDLPLQAGVQGESEDNVVRILEVHQNQNENGAPSLGSVSVGLHVGTRRLQLGPLSGSTLLLYSPQRHLVWLDPSFQKYRAARGADAGWSRHGEHLGWNGVLNYADGEDAKVDVSQLRLILLRNRYLGTSEWTWKSPEMRLADYPPRSTQQTLHDQPIYVGREVKAFKERLATLKPPTAESSEAEARRYLYDLVATVFATNAAYRRAALKDVGDAFRPLLQHDLPLMLGLRAELWPGWDNYPPKSLLDEYITDAQKEMIIDLTIKNAVLANMIIRKGWSEEARRLQPRLLAMPVLPRGLDDLLLKWGDDASLEKLMGELRLPYVSHDYDALDKFPQLRPRLEAQTREDLEQEIPVMRSMNYWTADRYQKAAYFGSGEALEICLRWMGMGGDLPSQNCSSQYLNLLKADGTKLWEEKVSSEKQWPRYRHLTAVDFEYLPEQRTWRLRKS